MALTYEVRAVRGEDTIEITGYEGSAPSIEIPAEIEGLPVRSIGAHAFENRQDLRQVIVPDGCRTLRQFAFYGCSGLEYLSFPDTCDDYYDGVIRQCKGIKEIRIRCHGGDNYILARELLRDVDTGLRFRFQFDDREVCLTFPEYVSEAHEDTYARAIHISFEGAGVAYRECVTKKAIDYAAYDRLLPRLTAYDLHAGMNIALDRLMTPEQLADTARSEYERFLTERSAPVLAYLIEERDTERIRYLMTADLVTRDAAAEGLQLASPRKETEICALLMEYLNQLNHLNHPQTPDLGFSSFSLDDW